MSTSTDITRINLDEHITLAVSVECVTEQFTGRSPRLLHLLPAPPRWRQHPSWEEERPCAAAHEPAPHHLRQPNWKLHQ